jgi:hypothetical protein
MLQTRKQPRTVQKHFNSAEIEKEFSADFDAYVTYGVLLKAKGCM